MKRRILSTVIAGILVIATMSSTIQVSATPSNQQVEESRSKYEQLKSKVNEVNGKIQEFDNQISGLTIKVEENNKQIDNINKEVENTNKEMEQTKIDISDKEELLGKRLREIYKSGGRQTDYITLISSATSLSDLVTRINAAVKIVNTDKKVVKELNDNKSKLDEKVASLGAKSQEIQSINNDIKAQKEELSQKQAEQEKVVKQAQAEQDQFYKEFLIPIERELAQGFMDVANNENSSIDELNNAISMLRAIREQIKSDVVNNEINNAIEKAKKTISDKKQKAAEVNRGVQDANPVISKDASALIDYAKRFLGKPYVWGAKGPNSFDCSGFTSYVYRNSAGVEIGGSTYEQINAGREVSRDELRPGDLVFPRADLGHVTMYIGNGLIIHAPRTGDVVKIATMDNFARARRILN